MDAVIMELVILCARARAQFVDTNL